MLEDPGGIFFPIEKHLRMGQVQAGKEKSPGQLLNWVLLLRGVILVPVSPPALMQVWNWAQGTVYLTGALDDPYNQGSFNYTKV